MAFSAVNYALQVTGDARVASGIDHFEVDGLNLKIYPKDGGMLTMTFPKPKDAVSIIGVYQPDETHFIIQFSDGTESESMEIPEQLVNISPESGNILEKRTSGLYVGKTGVEISKHEGNAIVTLDDGIWVADVQGVEISKDAKNIAEWHEDGIYVPATDVTPYATKDDLKKVSDELPKKANSTYVDAELQKKVSASELVYYYTKDEAKAEFGDKYSSTDNATAMDKKVDKVEGKQLSTEDYSTDEKTKLEEIEEKAEVNIIESITVNNKMMYPDRYRNLNIDLSEYQKTIEFEDENLVFKEKDFGGSAYGRRI